LLCVVLPALAVTSYYLFIASPQYVSTFRFTVRDSRSAASAGASDSTGIASLGISAGVSSSPNSLENFIVVDYLTSREAVDEIQSAINIRKLYSRSEADWLARFDDRQPAERLVAYWKRMASATYDPITGIAEAEVRAFTPEDTFLIATTMVKMSEQLINNIAIRPQRDAMRFAEEELRRSEERLKVTSAELTRFRNAEQVIDPQTNVVNSNLLLAQTLRGNLAQLQTDLATLKKQNLGPSAPMILQLELRIKSTREQLASVEGEVGNTRDGANILSKVVGEYEQLTLERGFAQDQVKSAKANFEQARMSAMIQHMYVTPFVSPALPQSSTFPKRILSILVATFGFFLFWLVGTLVVRSVREQLS
jgi:capsular polysaccharide transport system permease protein